MEITRTIQKADGSAGHTTPLGGSYDNAKVALEAAILDGTTLIALRTES